MFVQAAIHQQIVWHAFLIISYKMVNALLNVQIISMLCKAQWDVLVLYYVNHYLVLIQQIHVLLIVY